jgi:hypothetical protein
MALPLKVPNFTAPPGGRSTAKEAPCASLSPRRHACLATPALAGGLGDMTDEERAAFREEVRAYLLENPEVIVEAMTELQAARGQAAAADRDLQMLADHKAAIFKSEADWVGGNPEGDITLVEFMDYRCGYCRKAYQEVEELVKHRRQHPLRAEGIPDPGRGVAAVVAIRHRGAAAARRRGLQEGA